MSFLSHILTPFWKNLALLSGTKRKAEAASFEIISSEVRLIERSKGEHLWHSANNYSNQIESRIRASATKSNLRLDLFLSTIQILEGILDNISRENTFPNRTKILKELNNQIQALRGDDSDDSGDGTNEDTNKNIKLQKRNIKKFIIYALKFHFNQSLTFKLKSILNLKIPNLNGLPFKQILINYIPHFLTQKSLMMSYKSFNLPPKIGTSWYRSTTYIRKRIEVKSRNLIISFKLESYLRKQNLLLVKQNVNPNEIIIQGKMGLRYSILSYSLLSIPIIKDLIVILLGTTNYILSFINKDLNIFVINTFNQIIIINGKDLFYYSNVGELEKDISDLC